MVRTGLWLICSLHAVPHRPIPTHPFVPHPRQLWVINLSIIVDSHIRLARVLSMQAPGVLLQSPLPRNRQRREEFRAVLIERCQDAGVLDHLFTFIEIL